MKCRACNVTLSDYESTRKNARTGEYIDMCNHCFSTIEEEFEVIEREDLRTHTQIDEEASDEL